MSTQEQLEADIAALTPDEERETRKSVISIYGDRDWTLEEIATQARYWREAKVGYDPGRGDEESRMIVKFNGFIIDFFETETGSLGMTIEVGEEITPEAPSVDIFVDKNLKVISA